MDIFDKLLSSESRTKFLKKVLGDQQLTKSILSWLKVELWALRKDTEGIRGTDQINFHLGRIEELKRIIKALNQTTESNQEGDEIWWDEI